ncbi:hypothetical protein XENTR_v10014828 [Xenopus tropicalis]|nr:hypothetical protein XENTR_v10014828 [Xenopus tropicalis]
MGHSALPFTNSHLRSSWPSISAGTTFIPSPLPISIEPAHIQCELSVAKCHPADTNRTCKCKLFSKNH